MSFRLGSSIKHHRKEKDITQLEFANTLEITQTHLSLIENEKNSPSWELFNKIQDELNLSIVLIDNDEFKNWKHILKLVKSQIDKGVYV